VIKITKLSKIISHALRHEPELYGLSLDEEGWTDVEELLLAIKNKSSNNVFEDLTVADIRIMIMNSSKKRFELRNDRIRAQYGHSLSSIIIQEKNIPPKVLYHGTLQSNVSLIIKEGLKPMKRQYVHLSIDINVAETVAKRRKGEVRILEIDAIEAYNDGFSF
jgi:putative RNA 2'-phosphotransferase